LATIRKRRGPRGTHYQAIVRLAGHPAVRRTFSTRGEAETWAEVEKKRIKLELARNSSRRTLGDALERYTKTALAEKAKTTQRTDDRLLKWWYLRHGDLDLHLVTPDLIAAARDEVRRKASGPTANRYLAALSAVLSRAYREWGWIGENPVSRVTRYGESQGRVRWLTQDEIARLLDACGRSKRPELRTLVLMALTTGMRQGELLRLTWDDVDLKRRVLVLQVTKNGDRRGIPIADPLAAALRRLPKHAGTRLLFPPARPGTKDSWWTYRKPWAWAVAEAKLDDWRFHDTRHCAASYLVMNGVKERVIAELLGHKTLAMVKRYSHVGADQMAEVTQAMAKTMLTTKKKRVKQVRPPVESDPRA
jgi:integrase